MKKIIYLTGCLLLLSVAVQAQGIMIGARGGMNVGKVKTANTKFTDGIGGTAGIIFEAATNDLFSLQPELNYVYHTAKAEGDRFMMHYMEVPILFKFSTSLKKNNRFRFFGNLGPTIGLLMNIDGAAAEIPFRNGTESGIPESGTWKDYYNTHNVGFAVGAGMVIDNILIEGRYYNSFSNLARYDRSLTVSKFNITTAYLLVF